MAAFHRLARRRPSVALQGLVSSLVNLALGRRGLGRTKGALRAAEAAVRVSGELEEEPGFLETRAHGLDLLGLLLDESGRYADAVRVSQASIELWRHAVMRDGSPVAQAALALTLVNFAHRLRHDRRLQEATHAAEEAFRIYERLAAARWPIDGDEQARSRDVLDMVVRELGLGDADEMRHHSEHD